MKTLKLQRIDIQTFIDRFNVSLPFERSKVRNVFVREQLLPIVESTDSKRKEIVEAVCKKDDKGEKIILPNGQLDFTPEGLKTAQEQYNEVQQEEVSIEINEQVEANLKIIKDLIIKSSEELEAKESIALERIVSAIEKIA